MLRLCHDHQAACSATTKPRVICEQEAQFDRDGRGSATVNHRQFDNELLCSGNSLRWELSEPAIFKTACREFSAPVLSGY
jgi:hypothetical protein